MVLTILHHLTQKVEKKRNTRLVSEDIMPVIADRNGN